MLVYQRVYIYIYIYVYVYTVYSTIYIVHRNGGYLATEYENAKQHLLLCIHSSVIVTFPKCFGYIYIYGFVRKQFTPKNDGSFVMSLGSPQFSSFSHRATCHVFTCSIHWWMLLHVSNIFQLSSVQSISKPSVFNFIHWLSGYLVGDWRDSHCELW